MENIVTCGDLALVCDAAAHRYEVRLAGHVWTMRRTPSVMLGGKRFEFGAPVREEPFESGTASGVRAEYAGFGASAVRVHTSAYVERTSGDVYFEAYVEGDGAGEVGRLAWPAPFEYERAGGGYTVLSRMQGALLPHGSGFSKENAYVLERDAYLPMFGQTDGGSGYLAVFDTPFDARYDMADDLVQPVWIAQLGRMAYPRRMLYRFRAPCDYNLMAKLYRAYAKERGRFVTLREKIARNPNVARVVGCPVVHTDIAIHITPGTHYYEPEHPEVNDHWNTFAEQADGIRGLRARGLKKAFTHFDGWGKQGYDNLHPSPFPPHEAAGGAAGMKALGEAVREAGFIFGVHDQYRDYYHDAPDFDMDEAQRLADGGHQEINYWYGGRQTVLCAALAPGYVRRNYDEFERLGIPVEAAYLDVFSVVELDECFHPAHPITREQCAAYRNACYDILNDRGIIAQSEEGVECCMRSLALLHHAPFYTTSFTDDMSESVGVGIPLLNLVYHDCVIVPWIGERGSRGGFGIPRDECGYTHAILNAGPVYCPIDADADRIREVETACALAERLAFTEMTRHEFLDGSYRRQRAVYADGTVVEVDLDTDEYTIR